MLYFSSHLLTSFYRITDLCMILSQDREQDVRHETEKKLSRTVPPSFSLTTIYCERVEDRTCQVFQEEDGEDEGWWSRKESRCDKRKDAISGLIGLWESFIRFTYSGQYCLSQWSLLTSYWLCIQQRIMFSLSSHFVLHVGSFVMRSILLMTWGQWWWRREWLRWSSL